MQAIQIYELLKAGKVNEAMAKLEPEVKEEVFRRYQENTLVPKRGQPELTYTPAKASKAKTIDAALFWERFEVLAKEKGMRNKAAQSIGFLGSNTLPRGIRDNKKGYVSTIYADAFAAVLGQDLIIEREIPSMVVPERGELREINAVVFRERFYAYAKNFRSLGEAAQSLGFASSSHSPFRSLLDKRTKKSATAFADHLALFLGTEILGFEKKVSSDSEGVKVSFTTKKDLLQQYRSEALWIDPVKTQSVFSQYAKDNGLSITGLAKKIGFQDLNALSFFMHKRTPVRTGYGHFLAKLLGESILCEAPAPKTAKTPEVQKSEVKAAPPVISNRVLQPEDFREPKPTTLSLNKSVVRKPVSFEPASSTFRTLVSDYNLFEISERDMTLKTRARDFSDMPGFEAELKGFLQANTDLFRSYPSWADAREALTVCDRRWINRVRNVPVEEPEVQGVARKLSRKK